MLKRHIENKFDKNEVPTVGIESKTIKIELKNAHFKLKVIFR